MKMCSNCQRENEDQAEVCVQCGTKLSEAAPGEQPEARWDRVVVINSEVEAERLDLELQNKGIPHVMRSFRDSALDGLYQFSHGWGQVEAPAEHAEAIITILRDIREPASSPAKAEE